MPEREPSLQFRHATQADESLLLEWANDPEVRRNAFNPEPIDAARHHEWFGARLRDADCTILIAEDAARTPIGQVRFDVDAVRNEAVISISMDRAFRGRSLGVPLLTGAISVWREESRVRTLLAEVLRGNEASRRMFLRAGFVSVEPRRAGSDAFALYV